MKSPVLKSKEWGGLVLMSVQVSEGVSTRRIVQRVHSHEFPSRRDRSRKQDR